MKVAENYTKEELVEMLVHNNNKLMVMLDVRVRFMQNPSLGTVDVYDINIVGALIYRNTLTYDECIEQIIAK